MFLKYIFTLILLNSCLLAKDYSGEVKSQTEVENGIINMGPCLVNDSLRTNFILVNNGTENLYIRELYPTYVMSKSPNDPGTELFRHFEKYSPALPKTILNNVSKPDTLVINFSAGDTIKSRSGIHEAKFLLGLAKATDPNAIVVLDSFLLRVKKTPYYLSGFNDIVDFDSVYVNPNQNKLINWKLKNTCFKNIYVENTKTISISPEKYGKEFIFPSIQSGIDIPSKTINNYAIGYHPLDKGKDTSLFKIYYKPEPVKFPDSLDFAFVKTIGIGVEQKLDIVDCNYNFSNDTIDLGNIRANTDYQIKIKIKNNGNLIFKCLSQNIVFENNHDSDLDFQITDKFQKDGNPLLLDSTNEISIKVHSDDIKGIFSRLVLESDILSRKIWGVNQSKQYEYFYIKGRVISPKIQVADSIIDFGTVVFNNISCPTSRDTSITISNIGNDILRIKEILIKSENDLDRFYIKNSIYEIEPHSNKPLIVSFNSNGNFEKEFIATLIIITNQAVPYDTVKVRLSARGLPPVISNILIPSDTKSQPGRIINVPVVFVSANKNAVSLARQFDADLDYNRTMLEYIGVNTVNSAFEGATNKSDPIQISNKDFVTLGFEIPNPSYFKAKDTLFVLKFKTFLGNDIKSSIVLNNPLFSDGICKNLISLNKIDGVYYTDSVCGLDSKIGMPLNTFDFDGAFILNDELKVEYRKYIDTKLTLSIFNIYGELILKTNSESFDKVNLRSFVNGIYIIELTDNNYSKFKKVNILR